MITLKQITTLKFEEVDNIGVEIKGPCVVCDPCYFWPDALWSEFCSLMDKVKTDHRNGMKGIVNGIEFYLTQTAYGDGCYSVSSSNGKKSLGMCPVDAGLLCVVPLFLFEDVIAFGEEEYREDMIVRLKEAGIVRPCAVRGDFTIGNKKVITAGCTKEEQDADDEANELRWIKEIRDSVMKGWFPYIKAVEAEVVKKNGVHGLKIKVLKEHRQFIPEKFTVGPDRWVLIHEVEEV